MMQGILVVIEDNSQDTTTTILNNVRDCRHFCLFAEGAKMPFFAHTGIKAVDTTFLREVLKRLPNVSTIRIDISQGAI